MIYNILLDFCHAEKEKVYSRQYSAPILKRKSSRFGLGQLSGVRPPSAPTTPPQTPNNTISVCHSAGVGVQGRVVQHVQQ